MITSFTTPAQIEAYNLMVLKQALKLERVGLKHHCGALRPKLCKQYGLKARDSYDRYIAVIESKIQELLA